MNPPRILIVEDEFIVAQDLAHRLADLGYTVADRVNGGLDAVRSASALGVDLVLMDIQLKGEMDGIAAAREIRKLRSIPILFLTAFAEDSVLQRARAAEPFGYLLKPFDDRDLRATIEIALYKHQAEEDLRRVNRLYATLSQINQLIVRTRSLDELLAAICRVAVSAGRLRLAWIGKLDPATRAIRPVGCHGDCSDYVHRLQLTVGDPSQEPGLTATAILSNQECVCNDFANDPRVRPWRSLILAKGFGSAVALPLHQQSNVWGALMLYAAEPGFFQEPEVELAREIAEDISFALYHLELETQPRGTWPGRRWARLPGSSSPARPPPQSIGSCGRPSPPAVNGAASSTTGARTAPCIGSARRFRPSAVLTGRSRTSSR
jgi:CheY-like chemotaxis protein